MARKYQGTGLGLTLCKRILDMHQGKIWVESQGEDTGSRFIFTLPLRQVPESEAGRSSAA